MEYMDRPAVRQVGSHNRAARNLSPANSGILGRHTARSTAKRYNPLDSCLSRSANVNQRSTQSVPTTDKRQAVDHAVAGRVCAVSELRRYERQASEMDVLGRRTGTENVLAREMQSLLDEVQRQTGAYNTTSIAIYIVISSIIGVTACVLILTMMNS